MVGLAGSISVTTGTAADSAEDHVGWPLLIPVK